MASRMSSPWALAVACRTFLPIAHLLLLAPTDLAIAAFRVAIVRVATRIVDAMLVSTWTQDKTHVAVISVRKGLHGYRCGKGRCCRASGGPNDVGCVCRCGVCLLEWMPMWRWCG